MPKIFRDLEKKLEGIFEDLFGRAFRTGVQPIEIARKLIHEMDDNKRIGVSAVYVPNMYKVFLGKEDREKLSAFELPVVTEIEDYLAKHAAKMEYKLFSHPKVSIELDKDLKLGEFGISTDFEGGEEEKVDQNIQMRTMIYRPGVAEPDMKLTGSVFNETKAFLISKSIPGKEFAISKKMISIGRAKKNDLVITDSKVSREHAEITIDDQGRFLFVDLESTNGSFINGKRIKRAILNDGDVLALGVTEIMFKRR